MTSMENMRAHKLPVILVSAVDEDTAHSVIADIIDNEPPKKENDGGCYCRVWRISNKYYTMDVHLHPVIDAHPVEDTQINILDVAQAHIIYLKDTERSEAVAEKRAEAVGRVGLAEDAVRLALCSAEPPPPTALDAWALRRRYELVPLPAAPPPRAPPPGPFPELDGLERARAALHAHHWAAPGAGDGGELGSSSDGEGREGWEEDEGCEADVERFGAALQVALAARAGLGGAGGRVERLARAEALARALEAALSPRAAPRRDPGPV